MDSLKKRYKLYTHLYHLASDSNGFVSTDHCDSLLFSGLAGCSPDIKVNIDACYRKKDNTWHRRPLTYKSCYNDNHPDTKDPTKTFKARVKSALKYIVKNYQSIYKNPKSLETILEKEFYYKEGSTISRDMLIGLAWYAYINNRLDIVQSVIAKALGNWGVMGYGSAGAINIMPGLLGTYMLIEQALGGKKRWYARFLPIGLSGKNRGYTAHLEVLHLLLRNGIIKLSKKEQDALKWYASDQPLNPLFQYAAGNIEMAKQLLDNPLLWPRDRLPTNHDRREEWLFQRNHRDNHPDWLPRTEEPLRVHHGGDYIFMYWLLNSYKRK